MTYRSTHMRVLMFAVLTSVTVPAEADTAAAKKKFDDCIISNLVKFKDACEPIEIVVNAIVSSCDAEMRELLLSIPSFPADRVQSTMEKGRVDKSREVLPILLEYRMQNPCGD